MGGGEAGKEAVLPLSVLFNELNKNFDRQTDKLARVVSQSQSSGNTTLVLTLDGKAVARGVFSNAEELAKTGQLNLEWF